MNQPKLQQLHARLTADVEYGSHGGMVTKRDLRDLVACFLEEQPKSKWTDDEARRYGEIRAHLCDPKPSTATDVDAAVQLAQDYSEAVVRADKAERELARLRAEAKPEQAGREQKP